LRDFIADVNPEAMLMEGRDYDAAIIGLARRFGIEPVVAYSVDKILEILVERDGMTLDDAREHFEYNIIGAWVGEGTPIFVEESLE